MVLQENSSKKSNRLLQHFTNSFRGQIRKFSVDIENLIIKCTEKSKGSSGRRGWGQVRVFGLQKSILIIKL